MTFLEAFYMEWRSVKEESNGKDQQGRGEHRTGEEGSQADAFELSEHLKEIVPSGLRYFLLGLRIRLALETYILGPYRPRLFNEADVAPFYRTFLGIQRP